MGLQKGHTMKVWSISTSEKYTNIRVSTSKKWKSDGQYHQDFGGYVKLIGNAHEKASNLTEGCVIEAGDFEVTNYYDKATNSTKTYIAMFDFFSKDMPESDPNEVPDDFNIIPDGITEEDMPFK